MTKVAKGWKHSESPDVFKDQGSAVKDLIKTSRRKRSLSEDPFAK